MNFKIVTTIKVTFVVECYWGDEEGMKHDLFKEDIPTLAKALEMLKVAQISQPDFNWIIRIDVKETSHTHEEKN